MWRSKLWLSVLACAIVFALMFTAWRWQGAFCLIEVNGDSMMPTLKPDQIYLLDALSLRLHRLKKRDIIAFRQGDMTYTKRIYATAGEQVIEMWVMGNDGPDLVTSEKFIALNQLPTPYAAQRRFTHIRVPPGHVYVTGDNAYSMDSRDFGFVPLSSVVGVVRPLSIASLVLVSKEIVQALGKCLTQPGGCLAAVCLTLLIVTFYRKRRRARLTASSRTSGLTPSTSRSSHDKWIPSSGATPDSSAAS